MVKADILGVIKEQMSMWTLSFLEFTTESGLVRNRYERNRLLRMKHTGSVNSFLRIYTYFATGAALFDGSDPGSDFEQNVPAAPATDSSEM